MTEIHEDQNNRQRIMEEAVDLFAHKGYDAVSVREIAEAAEVTKPVIYYYFKNKRDLHDQLIREAFQEANAIHESIYQSDIAPDEKLRQLMQIHFQFCLDNPDRIKLLFDAMAGQNNIDEAKTFRADAMENFRVFSDFIRQGQNSGDFSQEHDPFKVSLLFIGTINIFIMHQLQQKQTYLSDAVANEVVDIILHGITNISSKASVEE